MKSTEIQTEFEELLKRAHNVITSRNAFAGISMNQWCYLDEQMKKLKKGAFGTFESPVLSASQFAFLCMVEFFVDSYLHGHIAFEGVCETYWAQFEKMCNDLMYL